MNLAIAVVATKSHTYTMNAQARAVQACLSYAELGPEEFTILLVGDQSKEFKETAKYWKSLFPEGRVVESGHKLTEGKREYTQEDQLLIAQMRTKSVELARSIGADMFWSLDSDVLPPANALQVSLDTVRMDKGEAYQVAACPYPSQGGGPWLCGRGSYQNWIAVDVLTEEHRIPKKLRRRIAELIERRNCAKAEGDAELFLATAKTLNQIASAVPEKYPPISDAWGINAKGHWRKRGWFNWAYPGIGWGAIVPSDWCGMGCTLITKRALDAMDWIGYSGGGTEDLFICWERWYPRGIKIAAVAHCPCHHVIRVKGSDNKYVIVESYHETEGEMVYHLRQRTRPFHQHEIGEKWDPANDGIITHIEDTNANRRKPKAFLEMDQPPEHAVRRKRRQKNLQANANEEAS